MTMKDCLRSLTAAAFTFWASAAAAEPVQPEGLPATPGQYSGYQDWLKKQKFTKSGMPDAVVNDYVQCAYQALHDIMTPLEREMLDRAAQGNGMSATELRAFERAVADRLDDGDATEHILAVCKVQYERFLAEKSKAGED